MITKIVAVVLLRIRNYYWNRIYAWYRSLYQIDPGFRFNGVCIQLYGPGRIKLATDSYIGEYSTIQAVDGESVYIGRHCSISHNVRFYTGTSVADDDPREGAPRPLSGSITVADGVWIGANCYISQGVRIGVNSVVGANSVVTRDIPENEIWGGIPARLIRVKQTKRHPCG